MVTEEKSGNTKVRRLYSMETIQVKYHRSVVLDYLIENKNG